MSQAAGDYAGYGGNPYETQNPYSNPSPYEAQGNPYEPQSTGQTAVGQGAYGGANPYQTSTNNSAYSAGPATNTGYAGQPAAGTSGYGAEPAPSAVLSNQDFLSRVDAVRADMRQLTSYVSEIGSLHQRALNSPDNALSGQINSLVAQTQVLNTKIRDQIKRLEHDAARSGKNTTKDSQIRTLKGNFTSQLQDYQKEEQTYRNRYQEQIARQYRIVNPDATEQEVQEASTADWGNEGVFQTALKSNRSGAATSALGAVRARHNDIQRIEQTLTELAQLFQDMAEQVALQEPLVNKVDDTSGGVVQDTKQGVSQLEKGIKSAARARKLKYWCIGITVLILAIIALVLGLVLGLRNRGGGSSNDNNNNDG